MYSVQHTIVTADYLIAQLEEVELFENLKLIKKMRMTHQMEIKTEFSGGIYQHL